MPTNTQDTEAERARLIGRLDALRVRLYREARITPDEHADLQDTSALLSALRQEPAPDMREFEELVAKACVCWDGLCPGCNALLDAYRRGGAVGATQAQIADVRDAASRCADRYAAERLTALADLLDAGALAVQPEKEAE